MSITLTNLECERLLKELPSDSPMIAILQAKLNQANLTNESKQLKGNWSKIVYYVGKQNQLFFIAINIADRTYTTTPIFTSTGKVVGQYRTKAEVNALLTYVINHKFNKIEIL